MISIILGAVLGLAVGTLNFKILLHMTESIARVDQKKAGFYAIAGVTIRTIIYLVFILAAAYIDKISIIGAFGGLLAASFLNLRINNKK